MPLPANLIEFPRQLVASRKARPRYAEGPLRDESPATPADCQLRIFEVDPAQISTHPAAVADAAIGFGQRSRARAAMDFHLAGRARTRAQRRPGDGGDGNASRGQPGRSQPISAWRCPRLPRWAGARWPSPSMAPFWLPDCLPSQQPSRCTIGHAAELRSTAAMLTLLRELAGRAPDQTALQINFSPAWYWLRPRSPAASCICCTRGCSSR